PFMELGKKQYRYKLGEVIRALSGSEVKESKSDYIIETGKNFSYEDYLKLPEESGYEVLEGTLIKEPSPNVMHQRLSRRLQRILEDYFRKVDPGGEVFDAPLDVTFSDITVVQPDLFYVASSQKRIIKKNRIDGSPSLIVEILSPYNYRRDRLQKMQIYQKAEVKHYWLVSPEEKTLECFALRDGKYTLLASGMDEDIVEHPDFTDLKISLEKLGDRNNGQ
ncbi:MAG: Uma2 family endonuclease, partial [Halanaerobiales bacterium]